MAQNIPSQEDQIVALHDNAGRQKHGPADSLRVQFDTLEEGHGPLIVCSSLGGEAEVDELGVGNGRALDGAVAEGGGSSDLIGIRLLPRHDGGGDGGCDGMWLCLREQGEEQREKGRER